jgi:hypothetical protein
MTGRAEVFCHHKKFHSREARSLKFTGDLTPNKSTNPDNAGTSCYGIESKWLHADSRRSTAHATRGGLNELL